MTERAQSGLTCYISVVNNIHLLSELNIPDNRLLQQLNKIITHVVMWLWNVICLKMISLIFTYCTQ